MAIRDRVTVKTVQGDVVGLTVERQGNTISHTMPRKADPYFRAVILDKNGEETDERIFVPAEQLSYVNFDRAAKPKK